MSTYLIPNVLGSNKAVVLSGNGKLRPVADIVDGISQQCVTIGDRIVYTNGKKQFYCIFTGGKTNENAINKRGFVKMIGDRNIVKWFDNDEKTLPASTAWDGKTTMFENAVSCGLGMFLYGFQSTALLGGLMGLNPNLKNAQKSSFNIEELKKSFSYMAPEIPNQTPANKISKLFPKNYKQKVEANSVVNPFGGNNLLAHVDKNNSDWRKASGMPEVLNVSLLMNGDKILRYNELVLINEDGSTQVISLYDTFSQFDETSDNFITMPFTIPENVTRIIYVLHGVDIHQEHSCTWWLFKR